MIHQGSETHADLTPQLVWRESRESSPDGCGYRLFCDPYRRWLEKLDLALRQQQRAGERTFVDSARAATPIQYPQTGERGPAAKFVAVAVLGSSSYTFSLLSKTGQGCDVGR